MIEQTLEPLDGKTTQSRIRYGHDACGMSLVGDHPDLAKRTEVREPRKNRRILTFGLDHIESSLGNDEKIFGGFTFVDDHISRLDVDLLGITEQRTDFIRHESLEQGNGGVSFVAWRVQVPPGKSGRQIRFHRLDGNHATPRPAIRQQGVWLGKESTRVNTTHQRYAWRKVGQITEENGTSPCMDQGQLA